MPIYEYQCKSCGHRLEAIQGFNDAPLKKCPECKKAKLAKLVSAPSFQLKGTGWYVTDFKNSGKPKSDSESGGTKESSSMKKDESNTEVGKKDKVDAKPKASSKEDKK